MDLYLGATRYGSKAHYVDKWYDNGVWNAAVLKYGYAVCSGTYVYNQLWHDKHAHRIGIKLYHVAELPLCENCKHLMSEKVTRDD